MGRHWASRPLVTGLSVAFATVALVRATRAAGSESDTIERRTPPVIVEAVAPAALPEDPSSFVTVINVEEGAGDSQRVEDLIGHTVGVQVRRFGGAGQRSEVSIRGSSGSQVVVLLDGIRLNSAQSGTVDLSTIPGSLIERIEIYRGGGGVQTGSDAIGGVINVITKRASATPRTVLSFAAGSFGTWEGSASRTGRWGQAEYVLGYQGFRTDGDWKFRPPDRELSGVLVPSSRGTVERVNNRSKRHSVLGRVGFDWGERARISIGDQFFTSSSGEPGLDSFGGAHLGQSLTAHRWRTRNVADVRLEVAGPASRDPKARFEEWKGELRLFHRYDRSRFKDPTPPFGSPTNSDNRNQSLGARLALDAVGEPNFGKHRGSIGFEAREDWLHAKDGGDPERLTLGVFVQDDVDLGWLRIIPALRFDHTERIGGEWLPRIGVIIDLSSWLRLKGNWERSYRVPNFDELFFDEQFLRGNPTLRPEDAREVDLGFEIGFASEGSGFDFHFEFAAFRRDIDNSIVFQVVSPSVVQATNTSDARVRGVEVTGSLGMGWLKLSANYTRLDTEVAATGNPLPGRPQREYDLRIEVSPPSLMLEVAVEVHHVSSIPVSASGNNIVSGRTTFDAVLGVDLMRIFGHPSARRSPSPDLRFTFTGRNLTDRSVRDARSFPQPGRTLSFGVMGAW